jgi:hypothetical protein
MVAFILGILDILGGISLFFARWDLLINVCWFATIFILIKSLVFIKSFASVVDIVAVILSILAMTDVMYNWVTYIVVIWWLQKGISSFF